LRIRLRLTVAFVLVAAVSGTALAAGSYLFIQRSWLEESQQRAGEDTRRQLVLAGQFLPDPDRRTSLRDSFARSGRDVVVVVDGVAEPSDPAVSPPLPARLRATAASGQIAYQRLDHVGTPLLVVGGRIGGSPDELYVIFSEERISRDLTQLRAVLLAGAVAVTLLAAAIGYALARRTLEPVSRASAAARALAEGLLDTRLPERSRDEFGTWAAAFNRMAAALAAKIDALSEAQRRERRFTADVAHELRTPVAALVAEASLLRDHLAELPEGARRPAELLVGDVMRLRHLVEELMEISRLDGGRVVVRRREVDLAALVRAVVAAGGWQRRVRVRVPATLVETDPRRVERVVTNLVANAVEHGGGGEVRLSVGPAAVCLDVVDQGPGIAREHLPRLFDRFYKADPSRTSAGSGLGLAIARENARLLGGDIEVTSQVGAGTRFRVTLPLTPVPPVPPVPPVTGVAPVAAVPPVPPVT
jgi:two-component system sensor histidine kinase MtrB